MREVIGDTAFMFICSLEWFVSKPCLLLMFTFVSLCLGGGGAGWIGIDRYPCIVNVSKE